MDTEKQIDSFRNLAPTGFVVVALMFAAVGGAWWIAASARGLERETYQETIASLETRLAALRVRLEGCECERKVMTLAVVKRDFDADWLEAKWTPCAVQIEK